VLRDLLLDLMQQRFSGILRLDGLSALLSSAA
jgi:hypothetical protein